MEKSAVVIQYRREDALRILGIRASQLAAWERAGLIPPNDIYSFQDLVQLRKLRLLRAGRLSAARIRASVHAMRAVSGVVNPLRDAGSVHNGSSLAFRLSGAMVDPIARQFIFDFDGHPPGQIANVNETSTRQSARDTKIGALFLEAVRREEKGATSEAIALYEEILSIDPKHAPACINLGTMLYNQRQFSQAEQLYRRATLADSGYALAFFDLGNVLDELQRLPESIAAYREAIRLVPGYADAHYNLALALERTGEFRRALGHWKSYIKLDPAGPWSSHARGQARKILEREKLSIIHRNPLPRRDRRQEGGSQPLTLQPVAG